MHDEALGDAAHEREHGAVADEPVRHAQRDPRRPQRFQPPAVARAVMQCGRQPAVVVELLGLELVHREHDRKAAAAQAEERVDERDVAEDARLVLDEDRVDVVADVAQLLLQVRGVEVAHAHERHVVSALAQAVADRERVVVDAAALIAREDDDVLLALLGQLVAAEREGVAQLLAHALAREVLEPAMPARDELLAQTLIADGALDRVRDAVR